MNLHVTVILLCNLSATLVNAQTVHLGTWKAEKSEKSEFSGPTNTNATITCLPDGQIRSALVITRFSSKNATERIEECVVNYAGRWVSEPLTSEQKEAVYLQIKEQYPAYRPHLEGSRYQQLYKLSTMTTSVLQCTCTIVRTGKRNTYLEESLKELLQEKMTSLVPGQANSAQLRLLEFQNGQVVLTTYQKQ